ncbi:MAG: histidine kinase dimerization/phospho-acceptor domain-containing protein, partial [Solirubrobacteraceae bacterium]
MLTAGRNRQVALALTALLAAATVTELVLLGAGLANGSLSHTSTRLYDIVVVGAAVICAVHTATRTTDRLAWGLMALALSFWAGGELYYDIVLAPAASVPIPSVSDIFWLLFYLPAYAALVLLARAAVPHLPASAWLDGLIGALGVSSVFAAVVFDTVLRHTHGDTGVVVTGLAYPVGDLALLAVFVSAGVASGRALLTSSWLLLGAGLTIFLVGDSIYLVQTANGTYQTNTLLDGTWPLALVLMGCGAWGSRRPRRQVARRTQNSILAPIGLSTLALGVLIVDHFHRTNLLALGLAAACILGVTIRLLIAFRDMRAAAVANELARDEAVEASNAKSMFVATVSHELRTPLNGVLGMTTLLLDTPLDDHQREYAEIVRSSGEGLLLIINDILDYSKMEAGKVELALDNFALRETIAEGCAMLLGVARAKGVELEVVADGELPAWLWG